MKAFVSKYTKDSTPLLNRKEFASLKDAVQFVYDSEGIKNTRICLYPEVQFKVDLSHPDFFCFRPNKLVSHTYHIEMEDRD